MSVRENEDIINEVLYEWNRLKHSPYKVARAVGIAVRDVLSIIHDHGHRISELIERHDGWGRPEIRDFIVARKLAHQSWDNSEPELAEAREAYEEGSIEMATGRDGRWLILYAFPRNQRNPRPDYFKPEPSI